MKLVKITISERSKHFIIAEAVNDGVKIPNCGGLEFPSYIYSIPLVLALGQKCRRIAMGFRGESIKKIRSLLNHKIILSQSPLVSVHTSEFISILVCLSIHAPYVL